MFTIKLSIDIILCMDREGSAKFLLLTSNILNTVS